MFSSIIVLGELYYGARKSSRVESNRPVSGLTWNTMTYDEGLSFEAPGGGDRSIQVSSDAVQSDFDILF